MILKIVKVNTNIVNLITNTYIVFDDETKETLVIDPGGEFEKIKNILDSLDANVKYIILTHCHVDHIGALYDLKNYANAKVLTSRFESEGLLNSNINLCEFLGVDLKTVEVDSRLDDNDLLHIGSLEFKVILTPGHTEGGISLYCEKEKLVFTGDTMFAGSWGRTDLPTGNMEKIMNSINDKLLNLPEDTVIYPGHGRPTTVKDEIVLYRELKESDF